METGSRLMRPKPAASSAGNEYKREVLPPPRSNSCKVLNKLCVRLLIRLCYRQDHPAFRKVTTERPTVKVPDANSWEKGTKGEKTAFLKQVPTPLVPRPTPLGGRLLCCGNLGPVRLSPVAAIDASRENDTALAGPLTPRLFPSSSTPSRLRPGDNLC